MYWHVQHFFTVLLPSQEALQQQQRKLQEFARTHLAATMPAPAAAGASAADRQDRGGSRASLEATGRWWLM